MPDAPNSDLYGAVNCCSPAVADNNNNFIGGTKSSSSSSSLRSSLKLGPPLLEIRRLKYSLYRPRRSARNQHIIATEQHDGEFFNNDDEDAKEKTKRLNTHVDVGSRLDANEEDDMEHNEAHLKAMEISSPSSLVYHHHETVLISRGNPGWGGNVSSTCLDFRPSNNNNNSHHLGGDNGSDIYASGDGDGDGGGRGDVVVRCATGLTSGSLCVHSLSNLLYCSNNNNDDLPQHAPTSTVAHYAPRQQRPATSVAWRPSNGGGNANLVAVGLVGSGNYGVFPSSILCEEEVVGGAVLSAKRKVLGIGSGGGDGGGSILYSAARKTTSTSRMDGVIGVSSSLSSSHLSPIVGSTRSPTTATGGGTGDRDFGTLVWDIEAQSSVVGGAGTLVGGGGGKKGGSSTSAGNIGKGGMASAVPVKSES